MKENSEKNEAFIARHETLTAAGKSRTEIFEIVVKEFDIKTSGPDKTHHYRAWVARLADPKRYGGRFSERMKKFQQQKKAKVAPPAETVSEEGTNAVAVAG